MYLEPNITCVATKRTKRIWLPHDPINTKDYVLITLKCECQVPYFRRDTVQNFHIFSNLFLLRIAIAIEISMAILP